MENHMSIMGEKIIADQEEFKNDIKAPAERIKKTF
jgi:hypothetical protein